MVKPIAISCRNLAKTYPGKPPVEAVRGIDLDVYVGECFGVLGPNGAGKTTTIEIIEGLLPATAGDVSVLGHHWNKNPQAIREQIGVSLQETRLSERLSVRETIQLFRSFYRSGLTVDECLASVSLTEKADAWVKKLSGGQRQRLAVATALVGDPAMLFLDEPTTGLDPSSRRELWDIIRSFRRRQKTVLLTTHYMEEAERLCDRVAIFDGGKVIALGTPRELIASLGAEHVIEFSLQNSGDPEGGAGGNGAGNGELDGQWAADLPSVDRFDMVDGQFRLTARQPHVVLPALMSELARRKLRMDSLTTRHASLEDVFVSLTGRPLSESGET
jgi:ABC-2 type transport system ATP-binding protein